MTTCNKTLTIGGHTFNCTKKTKKHTLHNYQIDTAFGKKFVYISWID